MLGDSPRPYCFACHSFATVEVEISSKRPVLQLCERDARHLVEKLQAWMDTPKPNNNKRQRCGAVRVSLAPTAPFFTAA